MATRTAPASKKLDRREAMKLTQLEDVIATANRWRMECAKALVEIRDGKLFRATHSSFEEYAQARWGYERAYVYQLCQWGEVVSNVSAIADSVPERESHARPLYALSPSDQRRAWSKVLKRSPSPTARDVEVIAAEFRAPLSRGNPGVIPYYGSKASLAEQIVDELPEHTCYVETHAGGAAVLVAKQPSIIEVINDLDDALINFYAVMRDSRKRTKLVAALKLTPYARVEWDQCRRTVDEAGVDAVERARRYYTMLSMGYGATPTSFSRSNKKSQSSYHVARVDRLDGMAERLRGVHVESMDAIDLIDRYDGRDTVFYVDPPYPRSARSGSGRAQYRFEMTDQQHEDLLKRLSATSGKVLLSGHSCPLYDRLLKKWRRCWKHRVPCVASAANERGAWRTDVLWANW